MKTYSSLSVDIIRFEAQDVVTASNPGKLCMCSLVCFNQDGSFTEYHIKNDCSCPANHHVKPGEPGHEYYNN